ncbi:MAG: hypothetical protein ACMUIA_06775 [bacterium]
MIAKLAARGKEKLSDQAGAPAREKNNGLPWFPYIPFLEMAKKYKNTLYYLITNVSTWQHEMRLFTILTDTREMGNI